MKHSPFPKAQIAVNNLLTKPGVLTPELRQAVEAHAAMLSGGERERREIPADLLGFINKVVLSPHQITDEEFQRLIEMGYSEDAIFELTLCAAVGAGSARLERGLLALQGLSIGARVENPEAK